MRGIFRSRHRDAADPERTDTSYVSREKIRVVYQDFTYDALFICYVDAKGREIPPPSLEEKKGEKSRQTDNINNNSSNVLKRCKVLLESIGETRIVQIRDIVGTRSVVVANDESYPSLRVLAPPKLAGGGEEKAGGAPMLKRLTSASAFEPDNTIYQDSFKCGWLRTTARHYTLYTRWKKRWFTVSNKWLEQFHDETEDPENSSGFDLTKMREARMIVASSSPSSSSSAAKSSTAVHASAETKEFVLIPYDRHVKMCRFRASTVAEARDWVRKLSMRISALRRSSRDESSVKPAVSATGDHRRRENDSSNVEEDRPPSTTIPAIASVGRFEGWMSRKGHYGFQPRQWCQIDSSRRTLSLFDRRPKNIAARRHEKDVKSAFSVSLDYVTYETLDTEESPSDVAPELGEFDICLHVREEEGRASASSTASETVVVLRADKKQHRKDWTLGLIACSVQRYIPSVSANASSLFSPRLDAMRARLSDDLEASVRKSPLGMIEVRREIGRVSSIAGGETSSWRRLPCRMFQHVLFFYGDLRRSPRSVEELVVREPTFHVDLRQVERVGAATAKKDGRFRVDIRGDWGTLLLRPVPGSTVEWHRAISESWRSTRDVFDIAVTGKGDFHVTRIEALRRKLASSVSSKEESSKRSENAHEDDATTYVPKWIALRAWPSRREAESGIIREAYKAVERGTDRSGALLEWENEEEEEGAYDAPSTKRPISLVQTSKATRFVTEGMRLLSEIDRMALDALQRPSDSSGHRLRQYVAYFKRRLYAGFEDIAKKELEKYAPYDSETDYDVVDKSLEQRLKRESAHAAEVRCDAGGKVAAVVAEKEEENVVRMHMEKQKIKCKKYLDNIIARAQRSQKSLAWWEYSRRKRRKKKTKRGPQREEEEKDHDDDDDDFGAFTLEDISQLLTLDGTYNDLVRSVRKAGVFSEYKRREGGVSSSSLLPFVDFSYRARLIFTYCKMSCAFALDDMKRPMGPLRNIVLRRGEGIEDLHDLQNGLRHMKEDMARASGRFVREETRVTTDPLANLMGCFDLAADVAQYQIDRAAGSGGGGENVASSSSSLSASSDLVLAVGTWSLVTLSYFARAALNVELDALRNVDENDAARQSTRSREGRKWNRMTALACGLFRLSKRADNTLSRLPRPARSVDGLEDSFVGDVRQGVEDIRATARVAETAVAEEIVSYIVSSADAGFDDEDNDGGAKTGSDICEHFPGIRFDRGGDDDDERSLGRGGVCPPVCYESFRKTLRAFVDDGVSLSFSSDRFSPSHRNTPFRHLCKTLKMVRELVLASSSSSSSSRGDGEKEAEERVASILGAISSRLVLRFALALKRALYGRFTGESVHSAAAAAASIRQGKAITHSGSSLLSHFFGKLVGRRRSPGDASSAIKSESRLSCKRNRDVMPLDKGRQWFWFVDLLVEEVTRRSRSFSDSSGQEEDVEIKPRSVLKTTDFAELAWYFGLHQPDGDLISSNDRSDEELNYIYDAAVEMETLRRRGENAGLRGCGEDTEKGNTRTSSSSSRGDGTQPRRRSTMLKRRELVRIERKLENTYGKAVAAKCKLRVRQLRFHVTSPPPSEGSGKSEIVFLSNFFTATLRCRKCEKQCASVTSLCRHTEGCRPYDSLRARLAVMRKRRQETEAKERESRENDISAKTPTVDTMSASTRDDMIQTYERQKRRDRRQQHFATQRSLRGRSTRGDIALPSRTSTADSAYDTSSGELFSSLPSTGTTTGASSLSFDVPGIPKPRSRELAADNDDDDEDVRICVKEDVLRWIRSSRRLRPCLLSIGAAARKYSHDDESAEFIDANAFADYVRKEKRRLAIGSARDFVTLTEASTILRAHVVGLFFKAFRNSVPSASVRRVGELLETHVCGYYSYDEDEEIYLSSSSSPASSPSSSSSSSNAPKRAPLRSGGLRDLVHVMEMLTCDIDSNSDHARSADDFVHIDLEPIVRYRRNMRGNVLRVAKDLLECRETIGEEGSANRTSLQSYIAYARDTFVDDRRTPGVAGENASFHRPFYDRVRQSLDLFTQIARDEEWAWKNEAGDNGGVFADKTRMPDVRSASREALFACRFDDAEGFLTPRAEGA